MTRATTTSDPDPRDFIDALPDACIVLDARGRVSYANPAASTLLREVLGHLEDQDFPALLPPEARAEVERGFRRAVSEGVGTEFEMPLGDLRLNVRVFPHGAGAGLCCRPLEASVGAGGADTGAAEGFGALSTQVLIEHASDLITRHAPDPGMTYLAVSPSSVTVLGYDPAELIGRSAHELIHPDDLPGASVGGTPPPSGPVRRTSRVRRRDGGYLWLETTSSERRGPSGEVVDILAISRDVTARVESERRSGALSDVTSALARPLSRAEVTRAVLTHVLPALGAYAGGVTRLSSDGLALEVEHASGYDDTATRSWDRFPLSATLPATDCVRLRRPIFASHAMLARDYAGLIDPQSGPTRCVAALPLTYGTQILGALLLSFTEDRTFDLAEQQFMIDVAAQCAQGLERARIFEDERRAAARARTLAHLALRLIEVGTRAEAAQIVLSEGRDALAAYGGVLYVLDPDGAHLWEIERQGFGPAVPSTWRRFGLNEPHLPALVARDGVARFLKNPDDFETYYPNSSRAARTVAAAVVPLIARSSLVGVLAFSFEETQSFSEEQRSFALTLAGQCALALERLRQDELAHASERRYRSLVEATNQIVWVMNALGRFEAEQPGWAAFTGQDFDDYQGDGWAEVIHPDDRPAVLNTWTEATATRTPCLLECRMRRADGAYVWFDVQVVPVLTDSAEVREWIGVAADITERQHNAAALRDLNATLEARVEAKTAEVLVQGRALEAFAAFTEAVGGETAVPALAAHAVQVLRGALGQDVTVAYWAPDDTADRWTLLVHSEDAEPHLLRAAREGALNEGGLNAGDLLSRAAKGRQALFLDASGRAASTHVGLLRSSGGVALYPMTVTGRVAGVLSLEHHLREVWSDRDRAVVRSLGRSLHLALERAELTLRLRGQNDELEARNAALEAFAQLSRELTAEEDALALVGRAQDLMLSLLPPGAAVYYEPDGQTWRLRSQRGSLRNPALQAIVDAGLPMEAMRNLTEPYETGVPDYQTVYDQGDDLGDRTAHIGGIANVPLIVGGRARGVFGVALFGEHVWTRPERILIETAVNALGLALERAASAAALRERHAALKAERDALSAFASFQELVGRETNFGVLARAAVDVLHRALGDGSTGYYELDDSVWRQRYWGGQMRPETLERATAGYPDDAPMFAEPARSHEALFYEHWRTSDLARAARATEYGATAFCPVVVGDHTVGVLACGLTARSTWDERDRAVVRAVARGLTLALERAQAARDLEAQQLQLRQVNHDLEAFTYTVSHDLRAPVRHMGSFAGLLRRVVAQDEKALRYVEVIENGANRMNTLIDGLLAFSRLGLEDLHLQDVGMTELVDAVRSELDHDLSGRRVTWQIAALPVVRGDETLLRQVLHNLLGNAVKYSRDREEAVVNVWSSSDEREHVVFVRDNGAGFDAQFAERLFQPFRRLHDAREFEGNGVGLASVKRIVERHGGRVWAESQRGMGATFAFSLPR